MSLRQTIIEAALWKRNLTKWGSKRFFTFHFQDFKMGHSKASTIRLYGFKKFGKGSFPYVREWPIPTYKCPRIQKTHLFGTSPGLKIPKWRCTCHPGSCTSHQTSSSNVEVAEPTHPEWPRHSNLPHVLSPPVLQKKHIPEGPEAGILGNNGNNDRTQSWYR